MAGRTAEGSPRALPVITVDGRIAWIKSITVGFSVLAWSHLSEKPQWGEGIFGQPEGQDYMISPWRGEGTAGKTSCAVSGQGKAGWDALEPTSAFMAKCA